MKNSNPFNRVKKENEVDYSVFPAHKTVRTSLRIGEATPVYSIEMIQGNHIELGLSQLTRFLTMDKPVMNDFEVNFGAFFVPYRALNKLAGHGVYTAMYMQREELSLDPIQSHAFDYEIWFNPVTPDNWRETHWFPAYNPYAEITNGGINPVGSLFDHLGYSYPYYKIFNSYTVVSNGVRDDAFTPGLIFSDFYQTLLIKSYEPLGPSEIPICLNLGLFPTQSVEVISNPTYAFIPFDLFCILNPEFSFVEKHLLNVSPESFYHYSVKFGAADSGSGTLGYLFETLIDNTPENRSIVYSGIQVVQNLLAGDVSADIKILTNGKFSRLEQLVNFYYSLYIGFVGSEYNPNPTNYKDPLYQTTLPLLTYLRIYGDYFLHPNYEDKNIWFETLGAAYLQGYSNNKFIESWRNYYDYLSSQSLFYVNTLRKGRCLPCMWETDPFTCIIPYNNTAGAGSVNIMDGDSITTLFYKRNYARYKDMVARLGTDFKTNVENLYGSKVNLTSETSQVVGFRRFDIRLQAIAQTASGNSQSTQLADFAGFAYSNDSTGGFNWTAEEHGIFMVLCWVRPKNIAYTTSIDKWTRKRLYSDFLNPYLGGVGFEDVLAVDVIGSTHSNQVVGQRERYFDYMCLNNEVSGVFRTLARNYSVDRELDAIPNLSLSGVVDISFFYITERDDVQRVFTDMVNDPILVQIHFEGSITRQLPAVMKLGF